MGIHLHNFKYYFLLAFYLYLIICSVDLLMIENDLVSLDKNIERYLNFTLFMYAIFITIFLTSTINNVMYYTKYRTLKDNDLVFIIILIGPDLILNLIYCIGSPRFSKYEKQYIDNTLFCFYIIPKLIIASILSIFIILFTCYILIYILDDCCFGKLIRNILYYYRGERSSICDDDDVTSNHNRFV